MRTSRWAFIALAMSCGVVAGCCSDDGERPPWERADGAVPAARDAAVNDGATDGGAAFEPVDGQIDLGGSRASVEVGGLRVTPGGLVRAWLTADLDADGDADAVLLHERPAGEGEAAGEGAGEATRALELLTYRRDGDELTSTGGDTAMPALGSGCALSALSLRLAAPGAVTLGVTTLCPPASGATADAPLGTRTFAVLATGPFPLQPRATALLAGDAATLQMAAADRDADGTTDAVLSLERGGVRVEVVWLDRTAGASVDPTATEKSLQAAVPPPGGRKRLQASVGRLQAIIDLRRLLCTGALDGSTLSLGERPAHECRASRATGNAIALLIRANVEAGRIPQARAALSLLGMEGVGLGEDRRVALEQSITEHMTLTLESTHEMGPVAELPPVVPGGRAPVRFLDDDRIWVESSPPYIYYVSSNTAQPVDPLPPATAGDAPTTIPDRPEARSGSHRAVGGPEGLWIGDGDAWMLLEPARVGGAWSDAQSLAIAPSGEIVAAVRAGHLQLVKLRRPVAPVPIDGSGTANGARENRDGGNGGTPIEERDPSAP